MEEKGEEDEKIIYCFSISINGFDIGCLLKQQQRTSS